MLISIVILNNKKIIPGTTQSIKKITFFFNLSVIPLFSKGIDLEIKTQIQKCFLSVYNYPLKKVALLYRTNGFIETSFSQLLYRFSLQSQNVKSDWIFRSILHKVQFLMIFTALYV